MKSRAIISMGTEEGNYGSTPSEQACENTQWQQRRKDTTKPIATHKSGQKDFLWP